MPREACRRRQLTASTVVNVQCTLPLNVSGFISRENCSRTGLLSATSISPSAGSLKITSGGGPICGNGRRFCVARFERRLRQRDLLRFNPHETFADLDDTHCLEPRAGVDARVDIEIEALASRSKAVIHTAASALRSTKSHWLRLGACAASPYRLRPRNCPVTLTRWPTYGDGSSAMSRSDGDPSGDLTAIASVTVRAITSPGRGQSPSSAFGTSRSRPSVAIRGSSRGRRPTSQKLARNSTGPSIGDGPRKISGIDRSIDGERSTG